MTSGDRVTYVLFFRDKKGHVKLLPNFFDTVKNALNTGEAMQEKEGWIDYGYKRVESPELKTHTNEVKRIERNPK